MNSRCLLLPALTCALTLAPAAWAQAPSETPSTDPSAEAEPPPPPPPPEPEAPPPPPPPAPTLPPAPPVEAPKGHGAGTIELRVMTMNNLVTSTFAGSPGAAGLFYATDDEVLSLNLGAGAGYFISPMLALGGDIGYFSYDDDSVLTIAPYVKFVTGMEDQSIGFVAEFSPGFVTLNTGDVNALQLALFAGGHLPIGRSAAFMAGLQVSRIDDFDNFGDGQFVLGLRYGLSVYLD